MLTLDDLIDSARRAVDARPEGRIRAMNIKHLAFLVNFRHTRTGSPEDLEEAIQLARGAIATIRNSPDLRPSREEAMCSGLAEHSKFLGDLLRKRYLNSQFLPDLEESIQLAKQAVTAVPEDDRDRPVYLNSLALSLRQRYSALNKKADLDDSIELDRQALAAVSHGYPTQGELCHCLGASLRQRYWRTGAFGDLEEAIDMTRRAIAADPESIDQHSYLNSLGICLRNLYFRTGFPANIDEAIEWSKKAVDEAPDYRIKAMYLNNLGLQLGDRELRTGDVADLDEAIQLTKQAISLTTDDDPNLAALWCSLALHFSARHAKTGALSDVDEAIKLGRQAVGKAPTGYSVQARRLNSLGNAIYQRYSRTNSMDDLEEAILVTQQSVDAIPEDHPDRALCSSNLGQYLRKKYEKSGNITDLEEAIRIARNTVQTMPKDLPDRTLCLSNLGGALVKRYYNLRVISDLEEAIQLFREAVDVTSENHPDRAAWFINLGSVLHDRYLVLADVNDLKEAISSFDSALRQSNTSTLYRIEAGQKLVQICPDQEQAYEAASIAVKLIPRLTLRSLENSDRQHILGQVVGLASDAAAIALQVGRGPFVALTLLEQGRGLLGASLRELRADTLSLQAKHPEIAKRFIRLQNELEKPVSAQAQLRDEESGASWRANSRYDVGKEFDKAVDEIRKLPGFEDFLHPPSLADMQSTACHGPIVVINVSDYRCDAILVTQHEIKALNLANLSKNDICTRADEGGMGNPRALEWLWDSVAGPILHALGITGLSLSEHDIPHVWWIPLGVLSRFPIHAAGYHDEDSHRTVLDRVMSSYGSSIKAILESRRRPQRSQTPTSNPGKALLVAIENSVGNSHSRLPYATEEVVLLRDICKSMALDPIEPNGLKRDIVMHLTDCEIFHFAGHGYTDDQDPSQSYLCLEDGFVNPLKVADLLEMKLSARSPFLAYLSACGTGRIRDDRFLDESIHLISACQLAGFRHVIGTLWDVNDRFCVDMARITYEAMKIGNMSDESVCRGLHKATWELRNRWLEEKSRPWLGERSIDEADIVLPCYENRARRSIQGAGKLPRDVVWSEDDEDGGNGTSPLNWVPYVHFGV